MVNRGLNDKVFIVTGAARGIGHAIAARLVAESCQVVMADIDTELLEQSAVELGSDKVVSQGLDIADQNSISKLLHMVRERFGKLDGLVNNAGILDVSEFETLQYARYAEVMRINLDGALLCAMEAVPLLKQNGGGAILNVASIMGLFGSAKSIPYSSAKGAMINLTRCLAVDLAPYDINVNGLAPGFIKTRMSLLPDGRSEFSTEEFEDVYMKHKRLPAGRIGTPEDIAGPAAFLLSSDAKYITGQTLVVDGGVTATF